MLQEEMHKIKSNSLSPQNYQFQQRQIEVLPNISRSIAVKNIIKYSKQNNNIIEKYSEDFFLNYFDRQTIQDLSKNNKQNIQLNRQQFVRKLTTFIKHDDDQTLFLIMNLIQVFKKIKDQVKNQSGIKITDFTSYICQKISTHDQQRHLHLKQIPADKIDPDPYRLRSIDLEPPIIISEIQQQIPQIVKSQKKKDKKIDPFRPLYQFFVSFNQNIIMTLGRLASSIRIYNMRLQEKTQITPKCFKKLQKKLAILSFAYSQKYKRIGCIINNIGLAFWEFSDNLKTQKVIQKVLGNKIFYLQLADEWITSDSNTIYYWNLKEQVIKGKISQNSKSLNDIQQILHLRSIAVSYTMLDQSKWVIIYQPQKQSSQNQLKFPKQSCMQLNFKRLTRIKLQAAGCHTIYYNRFTQTLIPLGYKNTVPVYSINNTSFDLSLICQLKSHQTIVTSITDIPNTDIIFTGDDRGNVIIWSLTNMRCQQVIRIANCIGSIKCVDNILIYSDTRLNVIPLQNLKINFPKMDKKGITKKEHMFGIFKYYYSEKNQVFIFTRKQCRILDMTTGKTIKVIILCSQDQEILSVQSYLNGFIIGTSKGDIFSYSLEFKIRWEKLSAHSSQVLNLKVDSTNKFFLSSGKESHIYIWSQKTLLDQGPRKQLINCDLNSKQEVVSVQLSQKYGLFITNSYDNAIKIWDYQSCKLCHLLDLGVQPTCIKICQQIPLLIIGCNNKTLFLYKFSRKQSIFTFKLIGFINNQTFQKAMTKNANTINKERLSYSIRSNKYNEQSSKDKELQLKNLQNQLNTIFIQNIIFDNSENQSKLLASYGKGSVMFFNIHCLIQQNFSKESNQFKKSANVQRPIKQNMIKQIYKSQFQKSFIQKNESKQTHFLNNLNEQYLIWNKKIHKDLITCMNVFESKYVSTICVDGYFKLTSLYQGTIVCSLNINYPLPIKWDYIMDKNQQLCNKIHQTLLTIDELLNNHQSPLTKNQFDAINVRPFLDMVCCERLNKVKKRTIIRSPGSDSYSIHQGKQQEQMIKKIKKIEVLKEQFSLLDVKGVHKYYPSLKSYQIYKRVKKIKETHKQNMSNLQKLQINKKKQQIQERQTLIQFFSPNYLPKLLNKDIPDKLILSQNYHLKQNLSLTKEDFKKYVYQTSVNFNQHQKAWPSKSVSRKHLFLQKPSTNFDKKSNLLKTNDYQSRSFNMTKNNLLKDINEKINKFKKQRKFNKF